MRFKGRVGVEMANSDDEVTAFVSRAEVSIVFLFFCWLGYDQTLSSPWQM